MKKLFAILFAVLVSVSVWGGYYKTENGIRYLIETNNEVSVEKPETGQTYSGDIVIPEKIDGVPVVHVSPGAFDGCTEVTSISIPKIRMIWTNAFRDCTGMKSILIQSGTISNGAFSGCSNLTKIVLAHSSAPSASSIEGVSEEAVLYVRTSALSSFSSWKKYVSRVTDEFPYTITVESNNEELGKAEIKQLPTWDNDTAIVEAVATEKGLFSRWSDGHTENPHRVTDFLNRGTQFDVNLKAEFLHYYDVSVSIAGSGKGSLSLYVNGEEKGSGNTVSGRFIENDIIRLVVTPEVNSSFTGWSDGETDLEREFILTSDTTINANLASYTALFTKKGNGTGKLRLYDSKGKIQEGDTVSGHFKPGTMLSVDLQIDNNSFLRSWSDIDGKEKFRTITLDRDTNIQADVQLKHTVTVYATEHGTVTGTGVYPDGEIILTATPDDDEHIFAQWTDGDIMNPRKVYVTSDTSFTATFKEGWNGTSSLKPQGEGTDLQPYIITNVRELRWIKDQVDQDVSFEKAILDADISITGQEWEPIGSPSHPFRSHFDGRKHEITDFRVTHPTMYSGLFGYAENATIENIVVRDAQIKGSEYAGMICGRAVSTNIVACDNYAKIEGTKYVGGICGYLDNATISDCLNAGEVEANGDYAGGVAGYLISATVESCKNQKSVISTGQYTGGVAGMVAGDNSTISACSSSKEASVRGAKYTGGLIGNVSGGSYVSGCEANGAVYGTGQETGGLIGTFDGSSAEKLTNYGRVESTSTQVGGVIGSSKNNSSVHACANAGMIIAENDRHIGGVIGNASKTTITSCINIGVVRGNNFTGGLVGYIYESSKLKNSANYGPVTGADYVGGLTGEARTEMTACLTAGQVKGTGTYVGAICGNLFQDQYAVALLYDNMLCSLTNAFGEGDGDGEGKSTPDLTAASVDIFEATDWAFKEGTYPRPSALATTPIAAAGASTIFFATGENSDQFAKNATLSSFNSATWSSKGGTKIDGTTAKPAVVGADTLYVTKSKAVKAVPVNVTGTTVKKYKLTITETEGGTVNLTSGEYAEGTEVELTATPNTKWHFVKWSDNVTDNPRTIVMNKDYTLSAIFEADPPILFNVTVTAGEGGRVNSDINGKHEEGSTIVMLATPDAKYKFLKWNDENTQNPRSFVLTQDTAFQAIFEKLPPEYYELKISAGIGGTVNDSTVNGRYEEGTEKVITATPDENYLFLQWSDGIKDNPRTVVLDSNITLTAEFAEIKYYTLTVQAGVGGTVNDSVNGRYRVGTEVKLEAKANEWYRFDKWSDNVQDNPRTITITSDTTITAQFAELQTVTLWLGTTVGGSVNASEVNGKHLEGETLNLKATPDKDHTFLRWSDGATQNPYPYTVPATDQTIYALFEEKECQK